MFFGAIGMSAAMAILAGMVSTGTLDEETGAPVLEDSYGITAVVMLFVFNSFFGIGYVNKLNNGCNQMSGLIQFTNFTLQFQMARNDLVVTS
jgi:hypothetical protein